MLLSDVHTMQRNKGRALRGKAEGMPQKGGHGLPCPKDPKTQRLGSGAQSFGEQDVARVAG